jgi:hypothetical protein
MRRSVSDTPISQRTKSSFSCVVSAYMHLQDMACPYIPSQSFATFFSDCDPRCQYYLNFIVLLLNNVNKYNLHNRMDPKMKGSDNGTSEKREKYIHSKKNSMA